MNEIKIRGLSDEVLFKLDQLKGTLSRNEFLKQEIEKIAARNEIYEIETKYDELLKMTLKVIEKNTNILKSIIGVTEDEEREEV